MKKLIFLFASIAAISATVVFNSCTSSAQKVDDAQAKVADANRDLEAANAAYKADIESFRKEKMDKIIANDVSIAEFKARVANEKKDAKAEYDKKIAELEQKNSDLKKRMDEYKEDGKDKWATFKVEFAKDMENLGQAFKDFTVKKK